MQHVQSTKRRVRDPPVAAPPQKENKRTDEETPVQDRTSYRDIVTTGSSRLGHTTGGISVHIGGEQDALPAEVWARLLNEVPVAGNGKPGGSTPTPTNVMQQNTAPSSSYTQGGTQPRPIRQHPTTAPSHPFPLTPPGSQSQVTPPPGIMYQSVTTPDSSPLIKDKLSGPFAFFNGIKATANSQNEDFTLEGLLKLRETCEYEVCQITNLDKIQYYEDLASSLRRFRDSKVVIRDQWYLECRLTLAWVLRLNGRAYVTKASHAETWREDWKMALEKNAAALDEVEGFVYTQTSREDQLRYKRLNVSLLIDQGWFRIGELQKILANKDPKDILDSHMKASQVGSCVGDAKEISEDMSSLCEGQENNLISREVAEMEEAYCAVRASLPHPQ
ncbi:hypothetical protein ABW20_dc0103657 [Dactylellina cionopaga]|nr:hypothetical protein ABW20_dc0103657 [Dactylellina cionopaga]